MNKSRDLNRRLAAYCMHSPASARKESTGREFPGQLGNAFHTEPGGESVTLSVTCACSSETEQEWKSAARLELLDPVPAAIENEHVSL